MSVSSTVRQIEAADDGEEIPVNDLDKAYAYSGGLLSTVTITWKTVTYVKTYTYDAGNLVGATIWEAQ